MEVHQKLTDLCLLCSEFMSSDKVNLFDVTQWTQRPLFELFASTLTINLSQHELDERQICQNCFSRFNELDEHQSIVEKIQQELVDLYNCSVVEFESKPEQIEELHNFPIIAEVFELKEKRKSVKPIIYEDPESDTKSEKKKRPRTNQNDPTGFSVMVIDGRNHYKCEICDKVVTRRPQLHRMTHSSERKFPCELCGQFFKSLKCLYGHKKTHRERVYVSCDLCGMKYLQKNQLRKHMDAIHLKTDFLCVICGKSYNRNSTLQVHMLIHEGEKNVICTVCGFRTHTKSKMTRHMKSHTGERNYSCEICGKKFLYSYNVIAHVNYVHKGMRYKVDESKLTCTVCGMKFQKQKKVKEHMAEVHHIGMEVKAESDHAASLIVEEPEEEIIEWIENY